MSTIEFNNLLTSHQDFLSGFAMGFTRDRDDANDLVQETFVKALRYKNNFKEGTNIKGWLYTIMRNIFINNYKKKRLKRRGAVLCGAWGARGQRTAQTFLPCTSGPCCTRRSSAQRR